MAVTVYLFDDDEDILLLCSIVLRQRGYLVHSNVSCEDIVQKVKSAGADIVFIDNKIPPGGGKLAVSQMLQDPGTCNIPIIYFSANTDIEKLSKEAGAKYFIQKPFDIIELEKVIERALA